jgi:hypothetical protein
LQNLSKKSDTFWINGAFFILFSHYTPTGFLSNGDKLLSKKIKYKYENIKLKKKESQAEGAQHLYYRIKS